MSYGPFNEWDAAASYSAGDLVRRGDYLYEAMTAASPGDDPRTATFTATLTPTALPGSSTTATLRKWRVWDYPAAYYMARLRGIPENAIAGEPGVASPLPPEIRTVIVRTNYQNNGSADADLYDQPASASYSGYGMPSGMDTNYDDPDDPDELGAELIYSFSAAKYANGQPYAYDYNLGTANGLCYQPTTNAAKLEFIPVANQFAVLPQWRTETQGQMISCYQTFSREFTFSQPGPGSINQSTPPFQDDWIGAADAINNDGDTIATDPDYETT